MNALFKKSNLLYLIFIRKCYNLKFWLRPLHRNKLLKAITMCKINPHGTIWYINPYDKLIIHMEDGPAYIGANGTQQWWINDKLYRKDGPASIWADGTQTWWINGNRHRDDGPAWIGVDGTQHWFINGNRHRENGPAVIYADGSQSWYINGENVDPF